MRKYRRHAVVVIVIAAAIINPTGDPFTLSVVAIPLYLLYEMSILMIKDKKTQKKRLKMKLPCRKSEAIESYELLLAVCRADDSYLAVGYKQMRDLLERFCRFYMHNESLQMTDLSARISFVAAKVGLSVVEQNRLHTSG